VHNLNTYPCEVDCRGAIDASDTLEPPSVFFSSSRASSAASSVQPFEWRNGDIVDPNTFIEFDDVELKPLAGASAEKELAGRAASMDADYVDVEVEILTIRGKLTGFVRIKVTP